MALQYPDPRELRTERLIGEQEQAAAAYVPPRALSSGTGAFTYNTRALRPASAAGGDLYFETDTGWLYQWTGTAWAYRLGAYKGTDAQRAAITPSAADNGALFYTTDTLTWWRVSAGAWAEMFVPTIVAPTLLNSWVIFGAGTFTPPGYAKVGRRVFLQGTVSTGVISSTLPIFTLPAGFRPSARLAFPVISNNAIGRVDVAPNGDVVPEAGSNVWMSLSGISFFV